MCSKSRSEASSNMEAMSSGTHRTLVAPVAPLPEACRQRWCERSRCCSSLRRRRHGLPRCGAPAVRHAPQHPVLTGRSAPALDPVAPANVCWLNGKHTVLMWEAALCAFCRCCSDVYIWGRKHVCRGHATEVNAITCSISLKACSTWMVTGAELPPELPLRMTLPVALGHGSTAIGRPAATCRHATAGVDARRIRMSLTACSRCDASDAP